MARTVAEKLDLVRRRAEIISRNPLLSGTFRLNVEVNYADGVLAARMDEPDEHQFRSLVLEVRHLLLEKDDAHLLSAYSLARRHLSEPELVHAIESAQWAHKRARRTLGIKLNINGVDLTPEAAADLWFNAELFHSDEDKQRMMQAFDGIGRAMVRYQFMDYIFEVARLGVWVGSVIEEAQRRGAVSQQPVPPATSHPHEARRPPQDD